jgi:predicted nucleic acid-binding protein
MPCLDSDFLVAFLLGDEAAERKLWELKQNYERLTFTPIAAAELFFGAVKSNSKSAVETTQNFLSALELLEFDLLAALEAGKITAGLEKDGQKIGEKDTLIAGIALRHSQPIVTRNKKHFSKIRGLKIVEW